MKHQLSLTLLVLCTLAHVSVWGDGKVYSTAYPTVDIPDQRALIYWAKGVETLVIDTSFAGKGTNFAWIVPLPSPPEIVPASRGLFPTLQFMFRPHVIARVTPIWIFVAVPGVAVFSLLRVIRHGRSLVAWLAGWIMFMIVVAIALPMFVTAGSSRIGAGHAVSVLDRKVVGAYETATIFSEDGAAVMSWLNTNGYRVASNNLAPIRDYARDGWCFVASRIRRDSDASQPERVHPLAFRFKSARPIYPVRLTAVDNGPCRIDLYVFGAERARAPRFRVARCDTLTTQDPGRTIWGYDRTLRVRHAGLKQFAADAAVGTRLEAALTPQQMTQDVVINWEPFRFHEEILYGNDAARTRAANHISYGLVPALLVAYALLAFGGFSERIAWRTMGLPVAIAIAIGFAAYFSIARTEFVRRTGPGAFLSTRYSVTLRLENLTRNAEPTISSVRSIIATAVKAAPEVKNPFTGQLCREEDSPGNYTVREGVNGVEIVWYDAHGAEETVTLGDSRGSDLNRRR